MSLYAHYRGLRDQTLGLVGMMMTFKSTHLY